MRRVIAAAAALVVAAWLLVVAEVVLVARHDAAAPADAIVVLGAAQYNGRPVAGLPRPPRPCGRVVPPAASRRTSS